MILPENAFPTGKIGYGRNYQIISTISVVENLLIENYFQENGKFTNLVLSNRMGNAIKVSPNDCEWLSQSFFRNEETLYGFSLIEKSNSKKMFLTPIKGKIDFPSFKPISKYYAKDKNHFYYGPSGKIIKEQDLKLFFDDTYREEWKKLHPKEKPEQLLSLWNSKIATAGDNVYWDGKLIKGVHSSLKRINQTLYADDHNVYLYDLQRIKRIEGVDMGSLVFCNLVKGGSIIGCASDKFKPIYKYLSNENNFTKYDFSFNAPLFESKRDILDKDYWWYKLEKTVYSNGYK